jgi:hypothetical protein
MLIPDFKVVGKNMGVIQRNQFFVLGLNIKFRTLINKVI